MTSALITIDTELSAGRQAQGMSINANYESSFAGTIDGRSFGVPWLMKAMADHDITGVFFVDPMPGLVYGPEIVERMVHPILAAGHEVQIHIHTEWLQWAKSSPVEGRTGRNIGDFSLADQIALIGWARDALVTAGAPPPNAFRAGNFGANDDSLLALAAMGIDWDSSFNADYAGGECRISVPRDTVDPVEHQGVWEAPVAGIFDMPGHFRPAQICALSAGEMTHGLRHAAKVGAHSFVTVTHSFEMMSRDRARPNHQVMGRCLALCKAIEATPGVDAASFVGLSRPAHPPRPEKELRLPANRLRTLSRMAQQAYGQWRYERVLKTS